MSIIQFCPLQPKVKVGEPFLPSFFSQLLAFSEQQQFWALDKSLILS